jgi:hypothetical protein
LQAVPGRARLTDLQRAVLGTLVDDAEPTWLIAGHPDVSTDRAAVEAVLEGLQEHKLVDSLLGAGGELGRRPSLIGGGPLPTRGISWV